MNRSKRDITKAFSEALVEAGEIYPNMVVLDSDVADSCKTESFRNAYPGRSFDLGIAEQSLPTIAAGLALVGKIPFYNSFAPFAALRGVDMIRQSIAYNKTNVKIIGHASGQTMGYTGPSHHTVEDISTLRAIPGMTILCPSDAEEVKQMVFAMAETYGPIYLRLSRGNVSDLHSDSYDFSIGITDQLREGSDVTIYTTGDVAYLALEASEELVEEGISCMVVNVPTLKPIENDEILKWGSQTKAAVTVEDHNIIGGLGSLVSEIYSEFLGKRVKRIGIPDTFTESDDSQVLRAAYGISVKAVVEAVRAIQLEVLNGRGR